jgi:hypothetical protein
MLSNAQRSLSTRAVMNWAAVSVNNKAMPYRHGLVYLDEEFIKLTTLLKLLS